MAIDFHSSKNKYTYTTREAGDDWVNAISSLVDLSGKRVIDIGCGGGIYSVAMAELGAKNVMGVDFSGSMIAAASEKAASYPNVTFRLASADDIGLPDQCADIILERALVHHLPDRLAAFKEAYRLLDKEGIIIIQERTVEDVQVPSSREHIRGLFFDVYPRLMDIEIGRRPDASTIVSELEVAGFTSVTTSSLWETRKTYATTDELARDLRARTGRSILHELTDEELETLIKYMVNQIPRGGPVVEKDRWMLWVGRK